MGEVVVEYTYDAWGKVLTTTGTMASTIGAYNPFRYRGYYYDTETGFYYLQSRYYDPIVGRFLNADIVIGAGRVIIGNNLFIYCNNSPVMYEDAKGTRPHDSVVYEEGDFVGLPAYNPDCDLCKAHGSYALTDNDGASCVFYNSSIEWSSPIDHVSYHNNDPDAAYGALRIRNNVRGTHHGIDFYPGDSGVGCSGFDGTEQNVYAMYYGTVIRISDNFFAGTGAVYILHDDGRMAVYGEINPIGLKKGDRVEAGQLIGVMMRSTKNTLMLHLEMYFGTKRDAKHRIDPTFVYDFEDRWNKG